MHDETLHGFSPATSTWFTENFPSPTPAQRDAWNVIAGGDNALVVAPTGSGKTLAAFLWSIDRLAHTKPDDDPMRRCRVLYVSPLKALAYDIERNLRQPLTGITETASALGENLNEITVSMRTADTPAAQRRAFARRPSDILITTPESLYLLLTSGARDALRGIDTVIVDEIHAVAGTKRGAHLSLCLERLDRLSAQPVQRVGLSATVRPHETVADFLGGSSSVHVVAPPSRKTLDVTVEVTVDDLENLDDVDDQGQPSVWPSITARLYELIRQRRSTIVFANSRLLTERLCARLNELATQNPAPSRAQPAELMAQSQAAAGAETVIARAHHGSMSRDERVLVETRLKEGRLPAVVATSSLELGIDMGAVDLVVQIGTPFTVAAGMQRIGRAGHHVGADSTGIIFPTHQNDLLAATVTSTRMRAADIEELRIPDNPIDVLAQHIVSMVAMDDWNVSDLGALVRRAAPFRRLQESTLHSVLDMLSGRYPSTDFAGLRPKIGWDRHTARLFTRRGGQRLAILNGGTIPDRGHYGVFLTDGGNGARVGELDEEMVYETRVGDVFLLGATSWRVDSITHDRVLVSPAAGQPARMPFWKGEDPGRPVELGRAIGAYVSQASTRPPDNQRMNDRAASNLDRYIKSQCELTGTAPTDRNIVVERFRDELGDWRIVVHCVLGARVNRPWAMAIAARLRDQHEVDGHVMATDDGIIARFYDTTTPPGEELIRFTPSEIDEIVRAELAHSPLFAARFRECAARALLLPRGGFHRRQPLWQQRQRAGQLFSVASRFEDFPITAEAARECLEDYFDMPALRQLLDDVDNGVSSIVETVTQRPSPFARSLLRAYLAGNVYGEDEPLAERRVAALNAGLLDELIGEDRIRIDPEVVSEAVEWLQWRDGRVSDEPEDVLALLRSLGDLSDVQLSQRQVDPEVVAKLEEDGEIVPITIGQERRWIVAPDAGRYRDGLGVTIPDSVPRAFLHTDGFPIDDLVSRYARTHGPFASTDLTARFGFTISIAEESLHRLCNSDVVTHGVFVGDEPQWCSVEVLGWLRRKTLAALRAEIAPVPVEQYVSFLADWQLVGSSATGPEAVAEAIAALAATPVPASALEPLVLSARVDQYSPVFLDELTAAGDIVWAGAGASAGNDGWVSLVFADEAAQALPPSDPEVLSTDLHHRVLESLSQARFFRELHDIVGHERDAVMETLWDLVWGGWISNDSLSALRAKLSTLPGRSPLRSPRRRPHRPGRLGSRAPIAASTPPGAAGRWYRLPERENDPTRQLYTATRRVLERDGVVLRGAMAGSARGFAGQYPVLAGMEESGVVRRGYFVSGLGAAQFALPGAVDRLRRSTTDDGMTVLSACDPASPFGLAVPWPASISETSGHRPGRKAGALVVISHGRLVWFLERGGRTLLTFGTGPEEQLDAAAGLVEARRLDRISPLTIESVDGIAVARTEAGKALSRAGFRDSPKGLRLD